MWVFPKRRFDVVWHTFNPRTGKIFRMHLTIFQRMSEMISSNMFDNAVSQDYHFFYLLWRVIFPRSCVGAIVTKFYRRFHLFGLILKWYKSIITTLIFFTDFISQITIYVCTYNILTICVVINVLLSAWKPYLLFSIDSVISLVDSNEFLLDRASLYCLLVF